MTPRSLAVRSLTLASALALLVVAPSTTSAATISVPAALRDLVAGPVLTGSGVAVATRAPAGPSSGYQVTVREFERGGRERITHLLGPPGRELAVDLAGSAATFAGALSSFFGSTSAPDAPVLSDVWAGRPLGSWTRISSCEQRGAARREVAVSGNLIAQTGSECEGTGPVGSPRITVTLRQPPYLDHPTLVIQEPAGVSTSELRFAGHYLAWRRSAGAVISTAAGAHVVYDTIARREVYTAPDKGLCDVSERGVLVCSGSPGLALNQPCHASHRLTWYSPEAPTAHVLPVEVCRGEARIIDDKVAVARRAGADRIELALVGLDGSVKRVTSFAAGGIYFASPLDFNGSRIAWATDDCAEATIHVRELTATGPELAPPRACPVVVSRHDVRLSAELRGRVDVTCPRGCRGGLTMRIVGTRASGFRRFVIPSDRRDGRIGFHLSSPVAGELNRLERAARLPAVVTVRTDRPGRGSSIVQARVTLRAR